MLFIAIWNTNTLLVIIIELVILELLSTKELRYFSYVKALLTHDPGEIVFFPVPYVKIHTE